MYKSARSYLLLLPSMLTLKHLNVMLKKNLNNDEKLRSISRNKSQSSLTLYS